MVNDASEKDDKLMELRLLGVGAPATIPAVQIKRSRRRPDAPRRHGQVARRSREGDRPRPEAAERAAQGLVGQGRRCQVERQPMPVKNVVGVLDGAGPLANETVVIGAHYDHLGYGGSRQPRSRREGDPLRRRRQRLRHDGGPRTGPPARRENRPAKRRRIVFIAFSGEEIGLLGSQHYAKNPLFPLEDTVAMINLDMVGRLADDAEDRQGQARDRRHRHGQGRSTRCSTKLNAKYDFELKKNEPAASGRATTRRST